MKREEKKKREELKKAQYEGIMKVLEKRKEGTGSYERPCASLSKNFREQAEYC